jgi:hypothetical protein
LWDESAGFCATLRACMPASADDTFLWCSRGLFSCRFAGQWGYVNHTWLLQWCHVALSVLVVAGWHPFSNMLPPVRRVTSLLQSAASTDVCCAYSSCVFMPFMVTAVCCPHVGSRCLAPPTPHANLAANLICLDICNFNATHASNLLP